MNTETRLSRILGISVISAAFILTGCADNTNHFSTAKPAKSAARPFQEPRQELAPVEAEATEKSTETVEMIVASELDIGDAGWATLEGVIAYKLHQSRKNLDTIVKELPGKLNAKEALRTGEIERLRAEVSEKATALAYDRAVRRLQTVDVQSQANFAERAAFGDRIALAEPRRADIISQSIYNEVYRFKIADNRRMGGDSMETIERQAARRAEQVAQEGEAGFQRFREFHLQPNSAKEVLASNPKHLRQDLKIAVSQLEIKIKEALQLVSKTRRAGADWLSQNANRMKGARIVLYGASLTVVLVAAKDLHDVYNGISGVAVFKRGAKPKNLAE